MFSIDPSSTSARQQRERFQRVNKNGTGNKNSHLLSQVNLFSSLSLRHTSIFLHHVQDQGQDLDYQGQDQGQDLDIQDQDQGQDLDFQGQDQGQDIDFQGQGQDQDQKNCPRVCSRPRPWPRGQQVW